MVEPLVKGDPVKVTRILKSAFGYAPGGRTDGTALLDFPETNVLIRTACEMPGGILSRRLRVDGTNGTIDLCPIERFDGEELKLTIMLREAAGSLAAGRREIGFGIRNDRYEGQLRELVAVTALYGICRGFFEVNTHASLFDVIPPEYRSTAIGIFGIFAFSVGGLSGIFMGWLSQNCGVRGFEIGFLALCASYLAAAVMAISFFVTFKRDRISE